MGEPSAPGSLLRAVGQGIRPRGRYRHDDGRRDLIHAGKIVALLPNAWLYVAVWVFGGISALLDATVFAELGALIPLSGGHDPFARRALGDYAGFFVGYTQWILDCAGNAAPLLLIGE